ncbi:MULTISPECIES: anti-sigma factor family protein [Nocardiopsidaceae]|uniref:Zf-HC2 domain-containing protein n=1 Tax=Streptomonospora nanhaiensis TaxID=1323731 RepID=A0ABY6YQ70_9ACTN|nr:zf-HC2 domain-containing protein [Streptomonospora nanhaiensis]WAE74416.1 zf-HC2 domain-containing protein [Streptomonospora nanhaiensis]
MSKDHLGERLSALVDGELGPVEHESALIHLAKCESCRFEADMMRRLKRRLTGLREPEPDLDFMGRLTSLSRDPGPGGRGPSEPPPGGAGFGFRPPLGSSRPLGGFPGGGAAAVETAAETGSARTGPARPERPARPVRRRGGDRFSHLLPDFPGGRYAVAGFAVATALLGTAFVAGGDAQDTPVVEPRLSDYAVEHAVTSRQIPVMDSRPTEVRPVGTETPPGYGSTETTR